MASVKYIYSKLDIIELIDLTVVHHRYFTLPHEPEALIIILTMTNCYEIILKIIYVLLAS